MKRRRKDQTKAIFQKYFCSRCMVLHFEQIKDIIDSSHLFRWTPCSVHIDENDALECAKDNASMISIGYESVRSKQKKIKCLCKFWAMLKKSTNLTELFIIPHVKLSFTMTIKFTITSPFSSNYLRLKIDSWTVSIDSYALNLYACNYTDQNVISEENQK